DLIRQVAYLRQYALHPMKIPPHAPHLFLHDDGERVRDVSGTRLEVFGRRPAPDQMRLAQLLACHLKEQEPVTLRSDGFRMLLVEFPGFEVAIGLASISPRPNSGLAHEPLSEERLGIGSPIAQPCGSVSSLLRIF